MYSYVYDVGNEGLLKVTNANWCKDFIHEKPCSDGQRDNDCKKKWGQDPLKLYLNNGQQ